VDYRILGPLEVVEADHPLPLGGPKQRSLLALLLLRANEVVSTDDLIDRLWGEQAPPTAAKVLQVQVWRLRKVLGTDGLVTRSPGYVLRLEPDDLDLSRFERLVGEARMAEPAVAAEKLRQALSLWRGPPLADLAYEGFASAEAARLEELRVVALEERIEADLAIGRHGKLVAELEALVAAHPLREQLRGQLMLALYGSGRQAEALESFQQIRRLLDEELGLEAGEPLKRLQQAILAHDPSLELAATTSPAARTRAMLIVTRGSDDLDPLLSVARPLAHSEPGHELAIAHVVEPADLSEATAALGDRRAKLESEGLTVRTAAFSSPAPGDDLARLASRHEADLVLIQIGRQLLDPVVTRVLETASCDVALLLEEGGQVRPGPIIVPFGAGEHDWAALELGAWLARAGGEPLRLIGAASDARHDGRDASRLLADASLIVQRTAGVAAEPLLTTPGREGVMALANDAGLLVVGLSERWRKEGLGRARSKIAKTPPAPTIFVRRGLRPGGLAPAESRTRFTWSMTSAAGR
jgi:DNA-binding SARP family transcriptional activator/nucleotide-binding universal stress UspA family protein